jgi:hypothetical protein
MVGTLGHLVCVPCFFAAIKTFVPTVGLASEAALQGRAPICVNPRSSAVGPFASLREIFSEAAD